MSSEPATLTPAREAGRGQARAARKPQHRRGSSHTGLTAHGEPLIWLTGGALAISLIMIIGLLVLVVYQGIGTFWPQPVILAKLADGGGVQGEVTRTETYRPSEGVVGLLPAELRVMARKSIAQGDGEVARTLYRVGNFELTQSPYRWVDNFLIESQSRPEWTLTVERLEKGRFYGELESLLIDGKPAAATPPEAWRKFAGVHSEVQRRWREHVALQKYDIGALERAGKQARVAQKQAELDYGPDSPEFAAATARYREVTQQNKARSKEIQTQIDALKAENARYKLRLKPVQSAAVDLPLEQIVRAFPANQLRWTDKLAIYGSRWGEYLLDEPRQSNREGGYFPAIWGTIALTLIMTLLVVPFGVLAALYLREYAKTGPLTSAVRIAINNLAGVPSIVFGAFGLGFFCYSVGGYVDNGPEYPWPSSHWFAALAVVVFLGVLAFFAGLSGTAARGRPMTPRQQNLRRLAMALWLASLGIAALMIAKTPFFHGFFRAETELGTPTFKNGGLLWASLTLALLTAPVVIVATEEALAAVPNSMREGSYACGASKWQTIRRIVLPRAVPGIMTGMILAIARGAGEVAPLMLVGVKKKSPDLPLDSIFPYVHADRSFLHLAYMIYDVGFQSPDSEAARPMLYTTTLLLIAIVAALNLAAVWLRNRLRRKFISADF